MTLKTPTTAELEKPAPVSSMRLLGARGKSATSEWRRNHPEQALAQHLKDEAKKKERKHEAGQPSENQTKRVECGMVYDRMEAHIQGFRILKGNRGYRCICDECA
jgi:hypothetical protein